MCSTSTRWKEFVSGVKKLNRKQVTYVTAMVAIIVVALVAMASSYYSVSISADGKTTSIKTDQKSATEVLSDAGIELGSKDKVDTSSFEVGSKVSDGNQLVVYRAKNVSVYEDGKKVTSLTIAGTVQDALDAANLDPIRAEDSVNYALDEGLTDNMKIEVTRAFTVSVKADGKTTDVLFRSGTVADALDAAGVTLGEDDTVSPSLDTEIKKGKTVVVKRIVYKEREETESIPYDTVTRTSSSLGVGQKVTQQIGSNGSKDVTYKDTYVDGELSDSTVEKSTVTKEAVTKIVLKGASLSYTGISFSCSTSVDNPLTIIHGSSTAYTAAAGAGTASGARARKGYVAVNPNQIPYGSKLYIKADDGTVYGYAIAADTGGFAQTGSAVVDLYMNSYSECCSWGRKNVSIYVLEWGNGTV